MQRARRSRWTTLDLLAFIVTTLFLFVALAALHTPGVDVFDRLAWLFGELVIVVLRAYLDRLMQ